MPWSRVVLPVAKVIAPIKKDKYIKTIFRELMPRLRCKLKKIAIAATVGMVSPILAKAEPSAKFKLLCKRLALAARTAAKPSGRRTNIAMAIPTIVFGAPAAFTADSIAGLKSSASPTTATNETRSRKTLTVVFKLLGLVACTLLSERVPSSLGR